MNFGHLRVAFPEPLPDKASVIMKGLRARMLLIACCAASLLFSPGPARAASVPAPQALLPDDTLAFLTAPEFPKLISLWQKSAPARFLADPAMKPFIDNFRSKWKGEFQVPLERELGLKLSDYGNLLRGQLTLAVIRDGWRGDGGQPPGLLLLVDTLDKTEEVRQHLDSFKKKWIDSGRLLRTEKVRGVDFAVLCLSSNDVPSTVRKLLPKKAPVQEIGQPAVPPKPAKEDLFIGQTDSLLIVGTSPQSIEKVLTRLASGSWPVVADLPMYDASHKFDFRDSPLCGWINVKLIIDTIGTSPQQNPEAPTPFDIPREKILAALGFASVQTLSFSVHDSRDGQVLQVSIGAPEATRQGLLKILAGEAKETFPPGFVPANCLKFKRWRLDGQRSWVVFEQTLNDMSPQFGSVIKFVLDSADTYAKEKQPGFDIRKNLIGNLGDDVIAYSKPLATPTAASSSLLLIGSPNAEELASSLKSILVFLSQHAATPPQEREILDRKIYSLPLGVSGLPFGGQLAGSTATLNYAASSGYVALSTDVSLVEEYLRFCGTQPKPLREVAGIREGAEIVAGPGASFFGYENQTETLRALFEGLRTQSGSLTNSSLGVATTLIPGSGAIIAPGTNLRNWMDFSLLPSFEKVSNYFSYIVYGGSATVDRLTFKIFAPLPGGLKQ